jgi:rod shape-determining protein MreD
VTDGLNGKLLARLAGLGLLTVIVQVAAVSQVHLFGVNADLLPIVVAAVGLLCGSMTGAVFGFSVGLFGDLALVQTVGLSSLLYLAIGYWTGRARELRDPQGPLVPIALGAMATAISTIGYTLMQFLLGVDAPVTFVLVREIVATILLNALIAGPVVALARRLVAPALPEDPRRRRRRRAYTTGGLSPLHRA